MSTIDPDSHKSTLAGFKEVRLQSFDRLVRIMDRLRDPGGCPWDRKQTPATLRQYLLEETYEVLEALDRGRDAEIVEELGDLLFQILFHARIGREKKRFSLDDCINAVADKLTRRHPHVFGKGKSRTAKQVLANWEKMKRAEKGNQKGFFGGLPRTAPACLVASRAQEKASTVGFDWKTPQPVFAKVQEEIREVRSALKSRNPAHREEEIGDLLFAVVNLSRLSGVSAEDALRNATNKFTRRFEAVMDDLKKQGKKSEDVNLKAMDRIWDRVKAGEKRAQKAPQRRTSRLARAQR